MITRIVKMVFREDKRDTFELIFNLTRSKILKFDGCLSVELHKDVTSPSIYFTISIWESADALENYRESGFFKNTWSEVKPLFKEKAQAWTLEQVH